MPCTAPRRPEATGWFLAHDFTSGCTKEAHNFAEATSKFSALGGAVVGVTNDCLYVHLLKAM